MPQLMVRARGLGNIEIMYEKILSVELKIEFFSVIFLEKTLFNSNLSVR